MIRLVTLCLALALGLAAPAAAWDPYWDDWWWEEPVVSYEPQPVDDVWWWQEPAWEPAPPPPPVAAAPSGIYYVTEVYVANTITVSGPLTTYGTATIAETPGTYARVADTVGTGGWSPFDGAAFNGRASLGDGRQVAGTYYENFVMSNGSFVPVSVVFFQDDADLAGTPVPTATFAPTPTPAPMPTPVPTATPAPAPTFAPAAAASPTPSTPGLPATPTAAPVPVARLTAPPSPRRIPVLRPGIASSPLGDASFSIEVLRGRSIVLWLRAVADGVTIPVSSWQVVSGEHTALGPLSGGGDEPFRARWDAVTRPGTSWLLRVEVTVVVDGISYPATGDVAVVVRSPALVR